MKVTKPGRRRDESLPHFSGIYVIRNLADGKTYVGQAEDIGKRWLHHQWELNRGKHINSHLQNAYNKHGMENFEFSILEKCDVDQLTERENYWIDELDSISNGYNYCHGGKEARDWNYGEKGRVKCAAKGKRVRPVYQLDKNHNIVKEWPSSHAAAKALGYESKGIRNCCNRVKHQKEIGGFYWVFKDEYDAGIIDMDYYRPHIRGIYKPVLQFSTQGAFIRAWGSIKEAAEFYNARPGWILSFIHKKTKQRWYTCCGFKWAFIEDALLRKGRGEEIFFPLEIKRKEGV